jgi:H/ACA ribonucleoprotein complex non-core subunit NAF1
MFLRRGESRSVISSRQSTPNPSQMRDQELVDEMYLSRNAYDAHGPYDVDFDSTATGPSRSPPIPYDDPYGDDYTAPVAEPSSNNLAFPSKSPLSRSSGSGRGYDRGEHHGRGRGRGRDRDRGGQRDRGRGRRGGNGYRSSQQHTDTATELDDSRGRTARSLSPTSSAIARATGQVAYHGLQHQQQQQQSFSSMYPDAHGNGNSWGYNHMQPPSQFPQHQYGYMQQPYQAHMQAPLVQPHINPRFASAFGIAINTMQQLNQIPSTVQQHNSPQNTTTHPTVGATSNPNLISTGNNLPGSFHWTDEWTVHHGNPASHPGGETKNIG